jgi:hypothetical protein
MQSMHGICRYNKLFLLGHCVFQPRNDSDLMMKCSLCAKITIDLHMPCFLQTNNNKIFYSSYFDFLIVLQYGYYQVKCREISKNKISLFGMRMEKKTHSAPKAQVQLFHHSVVKAKVKTVAERRSF